MQLTFWLKNIVCFRYNSIFPVQDLFRSVLLTALAVKIKIQKNIYFSTVVYMPSNYRLGETILDSQCCKLFFLLGIYIIYNYKYSGIDYPMSFWPPLNCQCT